MRPETAAAYEEVLAQLEQAIVLCRREEAAPRGTGQPRSRNLRAGSCPCGRKIRVEESTLGGAPILCGACAQEFEPVQ